MSDTRDGMAILAAVAALRTANKTASDAWDAKYQASHAYDDAVSEAYIAKRALDEIISNYNPE